MRWRHIAAGSVVLLASCRSPGIYHYADDLCFHRVGETRSTPHDMSFELVAADTEDKTAKIRSIRDDVIVIATEGGYFGERKGVPDTNILLKRVDKDGVCISVRGSETVSP